jgi:hypothetical protein
VAGAGAQSYNSAGAGDEKPEMKNRSLHSTICFKTKILNARTYLALLFWTDPIIK